MATAAVLVVAVAIREARVDIWPTYRGDGFGENPAEIALPGVRGRTPLGERPPRLVATCIDRMIGLAAMERVHPSQSTTASVARHVDRGFGLRFAGPRSQSRAR